MVSNSLPFSQRSQLERNTSFIFERLHVWHKHITSKYSRSSSVCTTSSLTLLPPLWDSWGWALRWCYVGREVGEGVLGVWVFCVPAHFLSHLFLPLNFVTVVDCEIVAMATGHVIPKGLPADGDLSRFDFHDSPSFPWPTHGRFNEEKKEKGTREKDNKSSGEA